jgi:hypothetical protein
MKGSLLLLLLPFLFLSTCYCRVIKYDALQLAANNYEFHGYAMWGSTTSPARISVNVSFTNIDNDYRLDRLHLLIGPYSLKYLMDFSLDLMYNRRTCDDLHKSQNIEEIATLLSSQDILYRSVVIGKNETGADIAETKEITSYGVWYAYIFNCKIVQILQEDKKEGVYMSGTFDFHNSYGYLEADRMLQLPIDTLFILLYSTVLLAWLYLLNKHNGDLLRLQKALLILIAVSLAELMLHLLTLVAYNGTGTLSVWAVTLTVVVSTLKRTLVRTAMLLLALGFDTVRALTRRDKVLLVVVAVLYAALSGAAQLTYELNGVSSAFDVLYMAPASIIDLTALTVVMIAGPKTVSILKNSQQWYKLDVYRHLMVFGIIFYLFGAMHLLFRAYVMMFKLFDQYWYAWWMWDLTHHALYWSILASLAWLFKPSTDNARLRFNPQDQQDQQVIEPLRVNEDEDEDYDFD